MNKNLIFNRLYPVVKKLWPLELVLVVLLAISFTITTTLYNNKITLFSNLAHALYDYCIPLTYVVLLIPIMWVICIWLFVLERWFKYLDESYLDGFKRAINDVYDSMEQTRKLLSFLKIRSSKYSFVDNENRTISVNDRTINAFNRTVKNSIVDINHDIVTVLIKIPDGNQEQKLLIDMLEQLRSQLSNQMPEYYFSGVEREKMAYVITGNKK
ncbi:hypothetical protein [Lapidilactobacillus dextrinicus]|uniref:hypothetical protein n=1 Tax=Lapidilactobacillus dextrinicus TaxID=51664 RepID=UPI0022E5252E|nr:hypothetical protein [Lapidilactobacillus dextrinicus]